MAAWLSEPEVAVTVTVEVLDLRRLPQLVNERAPARVSTARSRNRVSRLWVRRKMDANGRSRRERRSGAAVRTKPLL